MLADILPGAVGVGASRMPECQGCDAITPRGWSRGDHACTLPADATAPSFRPWILGFGHLPGQLVASPSVRHLCVWRCRSPGVAALACDAGGPLLSAGVSVLQRKEPGASARFLAVQLHESWSWSAVVRVGQHWILWCRPDRTAKPTSITATGLCFSPGNRLQSIDATQRVYVVAFRTAILQSSPCRRAKTHRSARSPS